MALIIEPADVADASKGKVTVADPRLAPLVDAANWAVRNHCGWHIAPVVTETVEFDTWGERVLQLPTLRLVSVGPVAIAGVAAVGYEVSKKGMIRFAGPLPHQFGSVTVELTHGFDSAPDAAQVITQMVLAAMASPMGATREQAGAIAVQWATTGLDTTDRDARLLAAYRIPGLG